METRGVSRGQITQSVQATGSICGGGGGWSTGLYSVSSKVLGDKMPNRLSNAWSLKKLAPLLASRIWVRYA